jgi:hypothetical protein
MSGQPAPVYFGNKTHYAIKMDLNEIRCKDVNYIQLAQDGVQSWAPVDERLGSMKGGEILDQLSDYQVLHKIS